MTEPRKHHYLPQFYLRGFAANGRSVCQIEKSTGRAYPAALRDVAAIRDYHRLDNPDAADSNAIEKQLANIETQLAEDLRTVLRSGITSPLVHQRLLELVALLRVRVPAFKASIEAFLEQAVRSVGVMLERKGQLPAPPKGFEDLLRMENLSVEISNWKLLEFMFRTAADPDLLKILVAMTPTILRAPGDMAFLSCDQPVAIFHPTASPTDPYGIGLAHEGTEVSFPLSRRVLLLLSWTAQSPIDRQATVEEVAEFNRRSVVMADSLVFAPERSEWAVETTARYRQCSAGTRFDLLETDSGAFHLARFRPVMRADRYDNVSN